MYKSKTTAKQLLGSIDCNIHFIISDLPQMQVIAKDETLTQVQKIRILSKNVAILTDIYAFMYSAKSIDLEKLTILSNLETVKKDIIETYNFIDLGLGFVTETLLNKILA